ncbi:hypothetical protein Leryth_010306 [Lithospermum erythrorhizon]|nr:hypothetical protein Leryth_010306 [Lithospermum erythrorhizon]
MDSSYRAAFKNALNGKPASLPQVFIGKEHRFVMCLNCNGSRKVFEENEEMLSMCTVCNENGLVRCNSCCH